MKFKHLGISVLISLFFCFATNQVFASGIEFNIKEKSVTDSSVVCLLIKNNTSVNYYLPIINTENIDKWHFSIPFDDSRFFFLILLFNYSKDSGNLLWVTHNCYETEIFGEYLKQWKLKIKSVAINDLTLLKAGDSIRIKIPVTFNVQLSKECNWKLNDDKINEDLNFSVIYESKTLELEKKFLNKSTIAKLKRKGYKLYTDEIRSNSVPVIRH